MNAEHAKLAADIGQFFGECHTRLLDRHNDHTKDLAAIVKLLCQMQAAQAEQFESINQRLDKIDQRTHQLKEIAMSDQDTINQIAADIGAVKDEVSTVVTELGNITTAGTNIEAELKKLLDAQQNNQPLDFTALQSALGELKSSTDSAKSSADNLVTLLPDPGPQDTGTQTNG